jgi:hypothetical protein
LLRHIQIKAGDASFWKNPRQAKRQLSMPPANFNSALPAQINMTELPVTSPKEREIRGRIFAPSRRE